MQLHNSGSLSNMKPGGGSEQIWGRERVDDAKRGKDKNKHVY